MAGKEVPAADCSTGEQKAMLIAITLGSLLSGCSRPVKPDGTLGTFPHFVDRSKPGVITITRSGRRFVNEAQSYHDFCQAMYQRCIVEGTDICAFWSPSRIAGNSHFTSMVLAAGLRPAAASSASAQSSVRNGEAGRPAPLKRLQSGFAAHA